MAYVVPCVRFNDVVRTLTTEICVPFGPDAFSGYSGSLSSLSPHFSTPRFSLRRYLLKSVLAFSFIIATLGTNGWLDLVEGAETFTLQETPSFAWRISNSQYGFAGLSNPAGWARI